MVPGQGIPDEPVSPRILASLFAPTLGWDKSEDAINASIHRLGLSLKAGLLTVTQALAVLDDLTTERGIVGVTARFVRSRGDFHRALNPQSERSGVREIAPRIPDAPPPSRRDVRREPTKLALHEIVPLLANTIGQEKAEEAVLAGLRRLGLPEDRLDLAQASLLFDALAGHPGIVGVTARFAKARLILKFGA
jgi:hypothetical protein